MQAIELNTYIEDDWVKYNNTIAKHLNRDDINNFTNWPIIHDTMFYGDNRGALDYLRSLPDWGEWQELIEEVPEGNPIPNQWHPKSSGNMIHQANHLARFLTRTNCKLANLNAIYEFGGGYGCMCRLIHKRGFVGKYVIMDIPAVQYIQKWYLGRTVKQGRIEYLLDSEEFTGQMEDKSLFIANWSLSEVTFPLRDKILQTVFDKVDYVLIAYQGCHNELNNINYFYNKMLVTSQFRWDMLLVPYAVTNRVDHYYMLGERL